MKKVIFGMVSIVMAISAPAFANDGGVESVGVTRQALGEQCSVITNYVEPSDGCGSGAGDIMMDITASLEGGKTYDILVEMINERDEIEVAYEDLGVHFSRDDNYRADGVIWRPPFTGDYQVNLSVINASTGVTVCATQSLVNAR